MIAVGDFVGRHGAPRRRVVPPLIHHPCGKFAGGASGSAVMVKFRHVSIVAHFVSLRNNFRTQMRHKSDFFSQKGRQLPHFASDSEVEPTES